MVNVNELQKGDILSEISHYTFLGKHQDPTQLAFMHHESKQEVTLSDTYVEKLLASSNIYTSEVKVGMEDKLWTKKQLADAALKGEDVSKLREGDVRLKGIRTIWEEIYSAQVFTVAFKKQAVALTDKKFKELREKQVADAIAKIEATATAKKGVAKEAKAILEEIQNNPIQQLQEGELRILRGYKIQFTSRDGKYDCIDMDIIDGSSQMRPVNINTIQWLIFDNVKYILE